MSPTSSEKYTGPYRKPRPDLYTVLLIVSFVALAVGSLLLYLDQAAYQFRYKGAPSVSMAPAALEGPAAAAGATSA